MNLIKLNNTALTELHDPRFSAQQIQVFIKRDDQNHPYLQGNKAHKLKLNLAQAQQLKAQQIISFGGAYSNHLYALAAACQELNIPALGIVRGRELQDTPEKWSPTLKQLKAWGMQLKFITREEYRLRHQAEYLTQLATENPNSYIIPEGGTNQLAVAGFADLSQEIQQQLPEFTHLITATGTGGTLAGFAQHLPHKKIIGIAALKQADYLNQEIAQLIGKPQKNWQLKTQYHGGGFGKITPEVQQTQQEFEAKYHAKHQIKLDRVYTAKMIHAFYKMLENQEFPAGSKIILYHSGGLQTKPTDKPTNKT